MHMVYHVASSILPVKLLAQVRVLQRDAFPGKTIDMANYAYVVLVQQAGTIIGSACVREHEPAAARTLESLCVLSGFQRKGVGSSILEYITNELSDLPMALHVDAGYRHDRLVDFYSMRGFEQSYTNDRETMLVKPARNGAGLSEDEYAALQTVRCNFRIV